MAGEYGPDAGPSTTCARSCRRPEKVSPTKRPVTLSPSTPWRRRACSSRRLQVPQCSRGCRKRASSTAGRGPASLNVTGRGWRRLSPTRRPAGRAVSVGRRFVEVRGPATSACTIAGDGSPRLRQRCTASERAGQDVRRSPCASSGLATPDDGAAVCPEDRPDARPTAWASARAGPRGRNAAVGRTRGGRHQGTRWQPALERPQPESSRRRASRLVPGAHHGACARRATGSLAARSRDQRSR